jgi:hypothetical protein
MSFVIRNSGADLLTVTPMHLQYLTSLHRSKEESSSLAP